MRLKRDLMGVGVVGASAIAALGIVMVVILVMGTIVIGGWNTLTWEFLTAAPAEGMTAGGIFPAIVGTVACTRTGTRCHQV